MHISCNNAVHYVMTADLMVGRRTCDLGVAGSRPGHDAAVQQP